VSQWNMRAGQTAPSVELSLDWGDYPLSREALRPGDRRALGPGARAHIDSAGGVYIEREGEPTRHVVGPACIALGPLTLRIARPGGAAARSAFASRDGLVEAALALTALVYFAALAALSLAEVPVLYAGEVTRGPALSFHVLPILTGHARRLTLEVGDGFRAAAVPAPVSVRQGEQHMILPETPAREHGKRSAGHSRPRRLADARPGGSGARARGWEGPVGNPVAPRASGTWAVIHFLDRDGEALADRRRTPQFEYSGYPIGVEVMTYDRWSPYVEQTLGREQLAAPFGEKLAAGYDWDDTVGNMFGPEPMDPRGAGLGLRGVGPGGDGRARSIGLGSAGPMGHGAGPSFDQGAGVPDESRFTRDASVGEHRPRAPSLSTRVAPDVVERALARERPRMQACVGRSDATVDLSFVVTPEGMARQVQLSSADAMSRACVERVLSGLRFSPGTSSPTTVNVRLSAR
jgi:hypothetical protein